MKTKITIKTLLSMLAFFIGLNASAATSLAIGYGTTTTTFPADGASTTLGSGSTAFKITAASSVKTSSATIFKSTTFTSSKIGSDASNLNTYYLEGSLTTLSATDTISALNIGAASSASSGYKYAVVYSSACPFDSTKVISTQELTSTTTSVTSATTVAATVPSTAKSFRIYRYVGVNGIHYGTISKSVYVFYVGVTIVPGPPALLLTSGSTNDTVMSTKAISTPTVYRWVNSTAKATVTWDSIPSGISAVVDSAGQTITISGTAASVSATSTYHYTATIASGNSITGSVVVTPYVTPAPTFSTSSSTAQSVKAGTAISKIVYVLTNATNAIVTGLPSGFTGIYSNDTVTISGTPGIETAYPVTYTYTVTATPLSGYTGSAITTTGTINVKDPSAKKVAFLYTGTTPPTGSTKLYSVLNKYYDVTVLAPTTAGAVDTIATTGGYNLIVLHEAISSGSAAAVELGKYIGQVPMLNTKVFMYGKTNWPTGTAANAATNDTTINVNTSYLSHPMFSGVTFKNDSVVTLCGATGQIRYVTGATFGSGVQAIANNKGSLGVSIIEKNNQTTKDSKKYMMIAIAASNENFTSNGLLVLKNACDYLMDSAVYVPAILTNLTVSAGTMSPAFTSAKKAYKVALSAGTKTYPTITATPITGATLDSISYTTFSTGGTATIYVTSGDAKTTATYTITFTDSVATGIKTATTAFKIYGSGSAVIVEGAAGANVSLVSVSGFNLYTGKTTSTKETLPVNLEKGVYIVVVDGVATKVLVK